MPPAHASCLAMLAPVFTMQPDGSADLRPAGPAARAGRDARAAGAGGRARARRRGGRRERLHRLPRRVAPRVRRGRCHGRRSGAPRPAGASPSSVPYAGTRFLTRGGLSGVPRRYERLPPLRRPRRSASASSTLPRRARRPGRRRRHDQPRHRGRRRQRLRPDDEPRPRHRRLPPRPRPAPEQHARRGRPRAGAAPAGRADGQHDGAEPRARRRRHRLAIGAGRGTRLRTALVGVAAGILDEGLDPRSPPYRPRFHRVGDVVNAEPGVDEDALFELEREGCTCAAGRHCTTTSAASACSRGPAARATRAAAAHAVTLT